MRAEGIGRLVLEIDMGGCAEGLLQVVGSHQRCGTVELILVEHLLGDVDPGMLSVEFLHAALSGEDVCQVVNAEGLLGGGVDGRQRLVGHVGLNVVPLGRNLALLEDEFLLFSHNRKVWNW